MDDVLYADAIKSASTAHSAITQLPESDLRVKLQSDTAPRTLDLAALAS